MYSVGVISTSIGTFYNVDVNRVNTKLRENKLSRTVRIKETKESSLLASSVSEITRVLSSSLGSLVPLSLQMDITEQRVTMIGSFCFSSKEKFINYPVQH